MMKTEFFIGEEPAELQNLPRIRRRTFARWLLAFALVSPGKAGVTLCGPALCSERTHKLITVCAPCGANSCLCLQLFMWLATKSRSWQQRFAHQGGGHARQREGHAISLPSSNWALIVPRAESLKELAKPHLSDQSQAGSLEQSFPEHGVKLTEVV